MIITSIEKCPKTVEPRIWLCKRKGMVVVHSDKSDVCTSAVQTLNVPAFADKNRRRRPNFYQSSINIYPNAIIRNFA